MPTSDRYCLSATVVVQRPKSELKEGERVVIRYENLDQMKGTPLGSDSIPAYEEGEHYPAPLGKEEGRVAFALVAPWTSFRL